MTTQLPPAGWYDDPQDSNAQRYWDGQNWTPHRQQKSTTPTTHQPASAAGPLPPPAPGTTPSDQLGPYVDKVRPHVATGQQFWSGLSRQRRALFAAVGVLAIVVGAAALITVFHSVTGGPSVDKSALQSDIIQRMHDESGASADSVTCAGDLPGVVGKTVSCEVKMQEGVGDFEVIATVTKVDGGKVAYDLATALTKEQLEQHIQIQNSQLGMGIGGAGGPISSLSCESGLQGKADAEARCKFWRDGGNHHLTARVTNVDGLTMAIDYMPDHD
jgi:Domain of unknown function (DUF4333)/Protein of unknown function (DUF2510)